MTSLMNTCIVFIQMVSGSDQILAQEDSAPTFNWLSITLCIALICTLILLSISLCKISDLEEESEELDQE